MNTKHVKIAFSLLFTGILPIMGMNLDEQKKLDISFNLNNVNKIAETDIDKGILLEMHLKELKEIESYSPLKRKGSIDLILGQNFDKQQKLMGLIECANFTCSPASHDLINYGLSNNLIPKELLEGTDNTVDSFYKIKNVYTVKPQQALKLVKEILPSHVENIKDYPLDQNFDAITNDIKTINYKNDEKELDKVNNLSSFETFMGPNNLGFYVLQISTDSKKLEQRDSTTKSIQQLFTTTSLPNKIALILRLNDLNKMVSKNIDSTKIAQANDLEGLYLKHKAIIANLLAFGLFIIVNAYETDKMTNSLMAKFMATLSNSDCSIIRKAAIKEFCDSSDLITPGLTASKALHTICFNKDFKLLGVLMTTLGIGILNQPVLNFTAACEKSLVLFGSLTGLTPLPQLYFLYKYFYRQIPYDKQLHEMKKEQKNIQNLIEEFKESVKKEYAL